jgi:hypothetical protein
MTNPLDEVASRIFRVKGSDPEQFCVAYSDPAVQTRGYVGEMKFLSEQQVRDLFKGSKSEAEIDYILEQARQRER